MHGKKHHRFLGNPLKRIQFRQPYGLARKSFLLFWSAFFHLFYLVLLVLRILVLTTDIHVVIRFQLIPVDSTGNPQDFAILLCIHLYKYISISICAYICVYVYCSYLYYVLYMWCISSRRLLASVLLGILANSPCTLLLTATTDRIYLSGCSSRSRWRYR